MKNVKTQKIDGTNVEMKKGENIMNNTVENGGNAMNKTQFNVWEYTKQKLCEEYLANKSKKNLTVKVRFMDDYINESKNIKVEGARKVFHYLAQQSAISDYEVTEKVELINGMLKQVYLVKVKGFNPKATAKSKKTGNTFPLFRGAMGRALENQMFNTKATA